MKREYFTIKLTAEIDLGVALADMTTAVQFETKNICVVPGVAEFWYGVVNYQGGLLWMLDSDRFFNGAGDIKPATKGLPACDPQARALANAPASRRYFEDDATQRLSPQSLCFAKTLAHSRRSRTALHRFFKCSDNQEQSPKLTAIIVRDRVAGDRKRVAIVTPQLKGIVAVEPTNLRSLAGDRTSRLHQCCSAVVQTAVKAIYLIDPAALLQEIHQESSILT